MSRSRPAIYLDHSATTPLRDEALAAMQPYFADFYGNPSSIHWAGRRGHAGLDEALRGIALARRKQSEANRLVVSPVEHPASQRTAEDLRDNYGFTLTLLPKVCGTGSSAGFWRVSRASGSLDHPFVGCPITPVLRWKGWKPKGC